MVNVRYQRRMAASLLKCGVNRVWIDPDQIDEVAEAVTRGDIRRLISYRVIQVRQKKGVSRGRARAFQVQRRKGRRKGPGSRSGSKYARTPRKRTWIRTIRPLREELRNLRDDGKLDRRSYRIYYRKARGSMFKSRAHLLTQLESAGVLKEEGIAERGVKKERAQAKKSRREKAEAARARVRRKAAEARAKAKKEEVLEEPAEDASKTTKVDVTPGPKGEDSPEKED